MKSWNQVKKKLFGPKFGMTEAKAIAEGIKREIEVALDFASTSTDSKVQVNTANTYLKTTPYGAEFELARPFAKVVIGQVTLCTHLAEC